MSKKDDTIKLVAIGIGVFMLAKTALAKGGAVQDRTTEPTGISPYGQQYMPVPYTQAPTSHQADLFAALDGKSTGLFVLRPGA